MRKSVILVVILFFGITTTSALTSEEISTQVVEKIKNQTGIEPSCWIPVQQAVGLYEGANPKLEWVKLPVGNEGQVPIYSADKLIDIIGVNSIDQADAPNRNHPALSDGGGMISVEFDNEPLRIEYYAILMDGENIKVVQFNPWNLKKTVAKVNELAPKSCPLIA